MKEKFEFLRIVVLMLASCFTFTSCGKYSEIVNDSSNLNQEVLVDEMLTMKSDNSIETSKYNDLSQERSEYTDRQAIEAVCIDMYGKAESDHIDYLMDTANNLSKQVLGYIASEEDVIEKARTIWIEQLGTEYIDRIESDTIKINDEEIKYQKDTPPYNVKFYEVYDTWLVMLNFPSGIREDGVRVSTPGMTPYFIIKGSNGKVIGALI